MPDQDDLNTHAASIVAQATGQRPKAPQKDPKAVSRGRKGGLARAENLTPEQRIEIAKNARAARQARAEKRASA